MRARAIPLQSFVVIFEVLFAMRKTFSWFIIVVMLFGTISLSGCGPKKPKGPAVPLPEGEGE